MDINTVQLKKKNLFILSFLFQKLYLSSPLNLFMELIGISIDYSLLLCWYEHAVVASIDIDREFADMIVRTGFKTH